MSNQTVTVCGLPLRRPRVVIWSVLRSAIAARRVRSSASAPGGWLAAMADRRASGAGASIRSRLRRVAVGDEADLLEGHQSLADHGVEVRQEGLDPLGRVDDLDHHRQVLREPEDLGRMDAAVRAEAERAAEDRGAGHAAPARVLDDDLVERASVMLVALADEDAEQLGLGGKLHRRLLAHTARPTATPRKKQRTPRPFSTTAFVAASSHSASRSIALVSNA